MMLLPLYLFEKLISKFVALSSESNVQISKNGILRVYCKSLAPTTYETFVFTFSTSAILE